jgi:uncharacterized protein YbdZ (MbtH family)
MANPFEDEDGRYVVLANEEEQHSLWPAAMVVPPGWAVVHAEDSRPDCLSYIEANWTDIRPASLRKDLAR